MILVGTGILDRGTTQHKVIMGKPLRDTPIPIGAMCPSHHYGAALVTIWWAEPKYPISTSKAWRHFEDQHTPAKNSFIHPSLGGSDRWSLRCIKTVSFVGILTHETSWGANQLGGFCSTCHVSFAAVYWTSLWRDWSTSQDVTWPRTSKMKNNLMSTRLIIWVYMIDHNNGNVCKVFFAFQLKLNDDTLFGKSWYFPTICNDWPSHSNCTKRVFLFSATWAV